MQTTHHIYFSDSSQMADVADNSIDLILTSPPYPMIEMWDDLFISQNPDLKKPLTSGNGFAAFEAMHAVLDNAWQEISRVLNPGCFACINIGDATRSLDGQFMLYPNHTRIISKMMSLGLTPLPCILWRKPTNAPTKFMGSGMLPAGAYITLEHEYILIFRKGSKRVFKTEEERAKRRESALFWQERNLWFSDIWFDIKGDFQNINDKNTRKRSAVFPFELAYRLINMFSVKEDIILDPFMGLGTTALAAMCAARNSIGYEIDSSLKGVISESKKTIIQDSQQVISKRLTDHTDFVANRLKSGKSLKHKNVYYDFPVVTSQEKELFINQPLNINHTDVAVSTVKYAEAP